MPESRSCSSGKGYRATTWPWLLADEEGAQPELLAAGHHGILALVVIGDAMTFLPEKFWEPASQASSIAWLALPEEGWGEGSRPRRKCSRRPRSPRRPASRGRARRPARS
ncbi:hypothetical protein F0U63_07785 [Cystobacter fuscus]|nr:hypothetical protein F0U63_07785 [Cystobacter fuscus]